jgi:DNA-binding NtrC family response regulator
MRQRPLQILLAEDDADLAELVERYLSESLQANVTHVDSAAEALGEELTTRHDLLLASMQLPDGEGLELVRRVSENNPCPAILMADGPTVGDAIAAVRLGVVDILTKPFDLEYLASTIRRAVIDHRSRRRERVRHKRLRKLVARIICERRDLAKRMDLICRDFVQAHRRLAEKVVQSGALVGREEE